MPAKKEAPKYEQPHYRRWCGMIQRCTNANNVGYMRRGARGIKVDPLWSADNPEGFLNFSRWVETEMLKDPVLAKTNFKITRMDLDLDYSPSNCRMASARAVCQNRATSVLDTDTVVAMRRYKKSNPDATLSEMELVFQHEHVNISRALRGITWSSVNVIEAPVKKYGVHACQVATTR